MLDVQIHDDVRSLTMPQHAWLRRVVICAFQRLMAERENLAADGTLAVILVDTPEIRKLHLEYFGDESETDVITFPSGDTWHVAEEELGDVVVCYPVAVEQARDVAHAPCREVAFLALHGMLHLVGFNDETEEDRSSMLATQAELLKACEEIVGEAPS